MESLPLFTTVRIAIPVCSMSNGQSLLTHLTEERLVAGGTVVHAESLNWVGGTLREKGKKELTAYTTFEKIPLIRQRVEMMGYSSDDLTQFVMDEDRKNVSEWIGRNVSS